MLFAHGITVYHYRQHHHRQRSQRTDLGKRKRHRNQRTDLWAKFEHMRQQLAQVHASPTSATATSLSPEGTRLGSPLWRAGEAAHHTPKLLPQPHDADAFGFLNWKPPPTSAALQSNCTQQPQPQSSTCPARFLARGLQVAGTQLLILESTGPERGEPPPCRTGTGATWCRRPA